MNHVLIIALIVQLLIQEIGLTLFMNHYNREDQKVHTLAHFNVYYSCVCRLDYSEGQEILKHNDSSDSLVDAVAVTGEEKHDRFILQC